jgi:acetyl-CoA carboxylase carboxyl transferase subunit alpha
LWRSWEHKEQAAEALKLTSKDMLKNKLIDKIIKEPLGGAHFDRETTFKTVRKELLIAFKKMEKDSSKERIDKRRNKFLEMGNFLD